ncbi:thaumatin-like protein [Laetiporus sulphureus 93-53]|uniref:Thaumatin-like protein n=1 Tax=Laetiporus sulphureus 93-53 TaxID=1314785 RepID=A0A165DI69_9APHY|nr:thaumatin-like protein [Laetiporus sulphureus 93-53]KZT04937.1 thaumatin-like protein [Laetiporus sulphureus 93-53]
MGIACIFCILWLVSQATARTFTVINNCSFTIWPAIYTGSGSDKPDYDTGWKAAAGSSVSFTVPDDWSSGRIWGRSDCNFTESTTTGTCVSASCSGGLQCVAPGSTPATLAEWTLSAGSVDYYDVSLVDGFNLPLAITNNVGCSEASCKVDLDATCPSALVGPTNSTGGVLGCKSACDANVGGDYANSPDCCTGSYGTAATCPSSGVSYYSFFKDNCPDAYAYAYDESSGTALWTCDASLNADYTLTFCPALGKTTASVSGSSGVPSKTSVATTTSVPSATSTAKSTSTSLGPPKCALKPPSDKQAVFALSW